MKHLDKKIGCLEYYNHVFDISLLILTQRSIVSLSYRGFVLIRNERLFHAILFSLSIKNNTDTSSNLHETRSNALLSSAATLIWHVSRFTLAGVLFSSAWNISRNPSAVTRHRLFCQTRRTFPSDFLRRYPLRVEPCCLSPCSWWRE